MIIKTTLSKIEFHFLFYVLAFIMIITGHFKFFILFMSMIIVHELGHYLVAYYYKWNILKIKILPFGGITIFNDLINRPLKEEFLIVIMGPIFQIVYTYILYLLNIDILYPSFILLLFNLIPIYPMDGSKVLNIILNKVFPFKLSYQITIYLSYIFFFLIFIDFNLILIVIFIFLFFNLIKENSKIDLVFNKFLFERYLYKLEFNKKRRVKSINHMYRDYNHIFFIEKKYYTERFILRKRFDFKGKVC